MPRLSIYKPEKGADYKFLDRNISEMFQVGGTDVFLHKYLGPKNPLEGESTADKPMYDVIKETNIQDLLFLENRDRKYDSSIYTLRGIYNVADIDFNLSQFGLMIDNDTVFMTVHINDFVSTVGRKPLSGDVVELPHLRDEFALNDFDVSLPRYFVIEDVGRAAEGFSRTWYPHLYRLKLRKISDSQQYADILTKPADTTANFLGDWDAAVGYKAGDIIRYQGTLYTASTTVPAGTLPIDTNYFTPYGGKSLQDVLSTKTKNLEINDAIIAQAEVDAPKSGYETQHFYTLALDENGNPAVISADDATPPPDTSSTTMTADREMQRPKRSGYSGYLLGDGVPPNGADFGFGLQFPINALKDDYFLRIDLMPNRLFRYDGQRWIKIEDAVRHTLTNTDTRDTHRLGFINNTKWTYLQELANDFVAYNQQAIDNGVNTILTNINYDDYHTAPYVVIKQSVIIFDYTNNLDNPDLVSSYTQIVDGSPVDFIQINLPDGQTLPLPGQWEVGLFNHREAERQSISKALRPKADF